MIYEPFQTMALPEFERLRTTPFTSRPPEYRLVCDVCKFEHAGTVGARNFEGWILVTWICYSCRAKRQRRPATPVEHRLVARGYDLDELDKDNPYANECRG